jgi:allophanate hydrolase subunit 2
VLAAISADQPKLAQLRPGDPINFRLLTMSEAEDRHLSLQAKLYEKSTDG